MTFAPRWEHFDHEADIGLHGVGSTPAQAFEVAALALTAVVTDPSGVEPLRHRGDREGRPRAWRRPPAR